MDPKLRNAIAEIVALAGLAYAALPNLHIGNIPAWVGPVLSLIVTVGNQFLKDSTPPPTPTPADQIPATASDPAPKPPPHWT